MVLLNDVTVSLNVNILVAFHTKLSVHFTLFNLTLSSVREVQLRSMLRLDGVKGNVKALCLGGTIKYLSRKKLY